MFFFSSRRRHTRLVSDWSSDVCSSDLIEIDPVDRIRYALRTWPQFIVANDDNVAIAILKARLQHRWIKVVRHRIVNIQRHLQDEMHVGWVIVRYQVADYFVNVKICIA